MHWNMRKSLAASVTEYQVELNQSPAFWTLTFNAHWDTAFYRLSRLYDQTKRALNLPNFLQTIQVNVARFDSGAFRTRYKTNQFIDNLSKTNRRPDDATLAADLASVSERTDPLVARLVDIRNRVLAHRDPSVLLSPNPNDVFSLSEAEFDTLIVRAQTIVNRYSRLFSAQTNSMKIVGEDDFRSVLSYVREGVQAAEARAEADDIPPSA